MKSVGIIGLGAYIPEKIITNHDLEKMVETSDDWIISRTGIKERRIADEEMATSDLALVAAQRAMLDANIKKEEIDLLILVSMTPDMLFPSTACIVQGKLGLRNDIAAFDLSAACSGFVYALEVGKQFVLNGSCKNVLIIASEVLSKVIDWSDRNTCVLFGDGAGAVVLSEVDSGFGIQSSYLGSNGSLSNLLEMPAGGTRLPASHDTIKKGLHYLKMKGNELFKIAVKMMADSVKEVLKKANISYEKVDILIPHQANMRIIDAVSKMLGFSKDKVFVNLDKYGNTSAASLIIAMKEALEEKKLNEGNILVTTAFGSGLTWGANVIKWGGDLRKR
ncbi:MAG: beta-ketoacyl-ACP synthase III [bacterium]|nr:beta-ketoacyl-ACP synthase III [bacterium]